LESAGTPVIVINTGYCALREELVIVEVLDIRTKMIS
jgi:hypothetical protein